MQIKMQKARLVDSPPSLRKELAVEHNQTARTHRSAQAEKPRLSPSLVALIQSKLAQQDDADAVWTTLMDSSPRSALLQDSFAVATSSGPDKSYRRPRRKPVPAPLDLQALHTKLMTPEDQLIHARAQTMQQTSAQPRTLTIEEGTTPSSSTLKMNAFAEPELAPPPLTPKKRRRFHDSTTVPIGEDIEASRPNTGIQDTTLNTLPAKFPLPPTSPHPEISKSRAEERENIRSLWKRSNKPTPMAPFKTLHACHSTPDLLGNGLRSRRTSTRPFTPSQIFDPEFPLFGKPTFEYLSLTFKEDEKKTARLTEEDSESYKFMQISSPIPRPWAEVHNSPITYEEQSQDTKLMSGTGSPGVLYKIKSALTPNSDTSFVTPRGASVPLPRSAQSEGTDEFLQRLKNRSRRLRLWRWRSRDGSI